MYYLKLSGDNIIKDEIPVAEAYINVISDDSTNLNKYSLYILGLIKRGKDIEYIEEVTKFKKEQIENELEYLSKIQLIDRNEKYEITKLGRDLIDRIEEINQFNNKKVKVLIDKITGLIIDYKDCPKKRENDKYIFVKDTYNNLNPVNSKEYFIQNYSKMFVNCNIDELNIEIRFNKNEYWLERNITNIIPLLEYGKHKCFLQYPKIELKEDNLQENEILSLEEGIGINSRNITGVIYKINFELKDSSIDKYRNIENELQKLFKSHNELLSDYAKVILNKFQNEKIINEKIKNEIYMDSISGIMSTEMPDISIKKYKNTINVKPIINIKKLSDKCKKDIINICFKDALKDMEIDNDNYIVDCKIDEIKLTKKIPSKVINRGVIYD